MRSIDGNIDETIAAFFHPDDIESIDSRGGCVCDSCEVDGVDFSGYMGKCHDCDCDLCDDCLLPCECDGLKYFCLECLCRRVAR
jgi:hypothetical protein